MKIKHCMIIDRPVPEVFAYVTDFSRDPEWTTVVVESKMLSEPPLKVGSKNQAVLNFFGKKIQTTSEVIEYELDRKVVSKSTSGTSNGVITYLFAESGEGKTMFTVENESQLGGAMKLLQPLVSWFLKNSMKRDLANLKTKLE